MIRTTSLQLDIAEPFDIDAVEEALKNAIMDVRAKSFRRGAMWIDADPLVWDLLYRHNHFQDITYTIKFRTVEIARKENLKPGEIKLYWHTKDD